MCAAPLLPPLPKERCFDFTPHLLSKDVVHSSKRSLVVAHFSSNGSPLLTPLSPTNDRYHSDPSGNYSGWKANAIGQGTDTAQGVLKSDWKEGMTLKEGLLLGCKILTRAKDGQLSEEKIEFGVLRKVWLHLAFGCFF